MAAVAEHKINSLKQQMQIFTILNVVKISSLSASLSL
jgi:hypothetical protein